MDMHIHKGIPDTVNSKWYIKGTVTNMILLVISGFC